MEWPLAWNTQHAWGPTIRHLQAFITAHPNMRQPKADLAYAISQGLFSLSPELTGVVMAVVTGLTGLVAALPTDAAWLFWVLNLAKGLAGLIVAFEFHLNTARTAAYIGFIVFALGLVERSKDPRGTDRSPMPARPRTVRTT